MFYSQYGEDKWLVENCVLPKTGVFVDVGAGGIENSNSLHFEEIGWKVLCIEPDKRHEGLSTRKLVDNSIIGEKMGTAHFTFHRYPQLNGLYHNIKLSKEMPMVTLDSVLEKHKIEAIDILSIDVEGNELNVLKGLNLDKYKPKYIIVEYVNQFKEDDSIKISEYLKGYEPIYDTELNLIFKLIVK